MPAELLDGLRVLPEIAEHTGAMAEATRSLPHIERVMRTISADTKALGALNQTMAEVSEATRTLGPIADRMASIESAMPVLVEVQQHLARVPDTLERLDARIGKMTTLLDRLMVSLDALAEQVETLQGAVGPLGRIAQRLPGRSRSGPPSPTSSGVDRPGGSA